MTLRISLCSVCVLMPVLLNIAQAAEAPSARERLLLDPGWRFTVGKPEVGNHVTTIAGGSIDPSQTFGAFAKAGAVGGPAEVAFDDLDWRTVDLPHDWAVELPFDEKADCAHGSKTVGPQFPASSVGWYRRTFESPAGDLGRCVELQFDGVFRDSEVYLNGHYLGRNFSGYTPFSYNITPYLNHGGKNTLAVKVNATSFEGWFYEGAGIYRHVWLVKTAPVHVPQWGTYVTSEVSGDPARPEKATLTLRTTVRNDSDAPASVSLHSRVLDGSREAASATSAPTQIAPWSEAEITQSTTVPSPRLWSIEDPHLYTVETEVQTGGQTVDDYRTLTGVRTLRYDAQQGFFLNGKRVFMKGTCNHQDHAGVGVALPDRVNVWRIEQLKAMGCNAYRASHNPPTPELLDACDRLGMLVMDENRTVGASGEALSQLERLIRRDRNHPSVVIWSLGNEEGAIQRGETGARILAPLHRLAKRLDPTRPTTLAMNGGWGGAASGVVDVQGCNYLKLSGGYDKFHQNHPNQPVIGTEEASHTTTRGAYAQDDALSYCHSDPTRGRIPSWASNAEQWLSHFDGRPYIAGGFAWTGFDYRGEPTPYHRWPSINSHFGIMDTCGFPKDIFYTYQAWWTSKPVLHLLPHWNWPDKVGQPIDVRVDGNAAEVELFVNGASQGRKPMPRLGHLDWQVTYQPGVLSAKGYDAKGVQVSEERRETTGAPAALRLIPDRATLAADGEDVAMVTVEVVDEKGRVVPTANPMVSFKLEGPGKILGVGNGNPTCHEPDQFLPPAPQGFAAEPWKACLVTGGTQARPETAAAFDDSAWARARYDRRNPMLPEAGGVAIYRTRIVMPADALAQTTAVLSLGSVPNGTGTVFLNGTQVGEIKGDTPSLLDLPATGLQPGANSLAVVVTATSAKAGLQPGGKIALASTVPASWKRSAFNGLAQIIVQAGRTPGTLKLTASGEGLKPFTATVTSTAAAIRPVAP